MNGPLNPSDRERREPRPLEAAVHELLGPGGRLASAWTGYEDRSGQLLMAGEVARAFAQDDVAVIEAGTGTGKTLAYLIPALLSRRKTVVSTGTKNLQEQIFQKDIPFIRDYIGRGFRAACLKGRENYLCLFRYKAFLREPAFALPEEAAFWDALREWAACTATGDRAELAGLPEDFVTWADLSSSADRCLGGKCPDWQDCFLQRARRAAAAADVVVVNHHLFMADLAVRESGHGEVIPDYEAVIFDEAHQLESVATQHFGLAVSSWRLSELRHDALREATAARKLGPALNQSLLALGHQADVLARRFFTDRDEVRLWVDDDPAMDELREFCRRVISLVDGLAAQLEEAAGGNEELDALSDRARRIGFELSFIADGLDTDYVYWAERRGRGLFLRASPIDVAPFFQERLYSRGQPMVFTSATLAAGRSFDYFRERMGLLPEVEGLIVDSPFDYARQTVLYVPRSMPAPTGPGFLNALVEQVARLLECSRGRAFVLFTSYRNLKFVSERLAGRLPWTCLVQGQAPRSVLLDRFKAETSSVLLATHSFWQGVDVPGESLSAVIIDKLPFPPPERPMVRARSDRMRADGQDPFLSYHLPEAAITLKQGLGRLVRSRTDRGLLAVLDSRLVTRGYGKRFLSSLPPSRLVHGLAAVTDFFQAEGAAR